MDDNDNKKEVILLDGGTGLSLAKMGHSSTLVSL